MPSLALVYCEADIAFAQKLAPHLVKKGWELATSSPLDVGTVTNPRQLVALATHGVLVLLSRAFVTSQSDRIVQRALIDATEGDDISLYPISVDADWQPIDNTITRTFRSLSYEQERIRYTDDDYAKLADSISQQILDDHENLLSLYNPERMQFLTAADNSTNKLLFDNSEATSAERMCVIQSKDSRTGRVFTFIFLYPESGAHRCKQLLDENCGKLDPKNCLVIRPGRRGVAAVSDAQHLKEIFGCDVRSFSALLKDITERDSGDPSPVFYEELFIPQTLRPTSPLSDSAEKISTSDFIENFLWLRRTLAGHSMIAVIGGGGAGKTHFIGHLHDALLRRRKQEVYYFSGKEVETLLRRDERPVVRSLYDIYQYSMALRGASSPLSKEGFELRFLSAETFFFVDGIEELIGYLGKDFHVTAFTADCFRLLSQNPKSTIITSSRVKFWDDDYNDRVASYEISLFDEDQKRSFYQSFFDDDSPRRKLVTRLDKEITFEEGSNLPLFCSCIARFVERYTDTNELQLRVTRGDYHGLDAIAFLIDDTVQREARQGITWDNATLRRCFERLAVEVGLGRIPFDHVAVIFEAEYGRKFSSQELDAFARIIFLSVDPATKQVSFRFPFLCSLFAANWSARLIREENSGALQDTRARDLFAYRLSPGSDEHARLRSTLQREMPAIKDGISYFILESFGLPDQSSADSDRKRRILSNLTALLLGCTGKTAADKARSQIDEIFMGPDGVIRDLHCIGFNRISGEIPRFDFRDAIIMDSSFVEYDALWKCTANRDTRFVNCNVSACAIGSYKNEGTAIARFESCDLDRAALDLIGAYRGELENDAKAAEMALRSFFGAFLLYNNYYGNRKRETIEAQAAGRGSISSRKIIELLVDEDVLQEVSEKIGGPKLRINPKEIRNVRAFREDYQRSRRIDRVIQNLLT
jgi:hypothetical protein